MSQKIPVAIVITDTHLKYETVTVVKSIFEQVHELCEKLDVSNVIHTGDFFTSRKAQDLDTLETAKDIFDSFEDVDITFHVIPGNHDKVLYNQIRSFLDIFSNSIRLHSTPSLINVHGVHLLMLPFFETKMYLEEFEKWKIVEEKYKLIRGNIIVMTHIGFLSTSNNDSVSISDGVSIKMFDGFKSVYGGHIHNKNYPYLGSAYQQNFGENDEKGCHVLYDDGSMEFIQLQFPNYNTFYVNPNEVDIKLLEEIKDFSDGYNRLVIKGTKEECNAIPKSLFQGESLKVVYEHEATLVITDNKSSSEELSIGHTPQTIIEEFSIFTEKQNIEITDYMVDKIEILFNN
jgi:DNA repair exonuclease SbcCD nuclease subunit